MSFSSDIKKDVHVKAEEASHHEGLAQIVEIDTFRVCGLSSEDADFYTNFPEQDRKKVFHKVRMASFPRRRDSVLTVTKVDIRLIPMLAALYLICHIDRANIGNAKIEGMIEDLNMTGVQYNIVLSICESALTDHYTAVTSC